MHECAGIVIGAVAEGCLRDTVIGLSTLRGTGYRGRVMLWAAAGFSERSRALLAPFAVEFPAWDVPTDLQRFSTGVQKYFFARELLRELHCGTEPVLFGVLNAMLFQKNPVSLVDGQKLLVATMSRETAVGSIPGARYWIHRLYGLRRFWQIAKRPLLSELCLLGSAHAMSSYLAAMCEHIAAIEQSYSRCAFLAAIHNELLYGELAHLVAPANSEKPDCILLGYDGLSDLRLDSRADIVAEGGYKPGVILNYKAALHLARFYVQRYSECGLR